MSMRVFLRLRKIVRLETLSDIKLKFKSRMTNGCVKINKIMLS